MASELDAAVHDLGTDRVGALAECRVGGDITQALSARKTYSRNALVVAGAM